MARTLVASDNFNRASLGSDWSMVCTIRGNIVITASTKVWGEYAAIADDHPTAKWAGAGTFTDDQYSSAVLLDSTPPGSTYRFGVIVRASTGTNATRDYYEAYVALITGAVTTHLVKFVDGVATYIHTSSSPTWADNDRIELEVEGNTLRVCKNGTPLGVPNAADSASPSTAALRTNAPSGSPPGSAAAASMPPRTRMVVSNKLTSTSGVMFSRVATKARAASARLRRRSTISVSSASTAVRPRCSQSRAPRDVGCSSSLPNA